MTLKEKKLIHKDEVSEPRVEWVKLAEFTVENVLPFELLDFLNEYYHSQIDELRIKNTKLSQDQKEEFLLKLPHFLYWIYSTFRIKDAKVYDISNYK